MRTPRREHQTPLWPAGEDLPLWTCTPVQPAVGHDNNTHDLTRPERPDYVYLDALALSSGTLATLTGICDCNELDRIQTTFAAFVLAHPHTFATWQDAWHAYQASKQ